MQSIALRLEDTCQWPVGVVADPATGKVVQKLLPSLVLLPGEISGELFRRKIDWADLPEDVRRGLTWVTIHGGTRLPAPILCPGCGLEHRAVLQLLRCLHGWSSPERKNWGNRLLVANTADMDNLLASGLPRGRDAEDLIVHFAFWQVASCVRKVRGRTVLVIGKEDRA